MTNFDWTPIITAIITAFFATFGVAIKNIWDKHIAPWLEDKQLTQAAQIVINAVEAILGRGNGSAKWDLAMAKMKERGFDVDSDAVRQAMLSAWQELNLWQIGAGAKEADEEPPTPSEPEVNPEEEYSEPEPSYEN